MFDENRRAQDKKGGCWNINEDFFLRKNRKGGIKSEKNCRKKICRGGIQLGMLE